MHSWRTLLQAMIAQQGLLRQAPVSVMVVAVDSRVREYEAKVCPLTAFVQSSPEGGKESMLVKESRRHTFGPP